MLSNIHCWLSISALSSVPSLHPYSLIYALIPLQRNVYNITGGCILTQLLIYQLPVFNYLSIINKHISEHELSHNVLCQFKGQIEINRRICKQEQVCTHEQSHKNGADSFGHGPALFQVNAFQFFENSKLWGIRKRNTSNQNIRAPFLGKQKCIFSLPTGAEEQQSQLTKQTLGYMSNMSEMSHCGMHALQWQPAEAFMSLSQSRLAGERIRP